MKLSEFLSTPGSVVSLARAIGVAPSVVSQWKNGVRQVPVERCHDIERATEGAVTCEELRPDLADLWAYFRNSRKQEAA